MPSEWVMTVIGSLSVASVCATVALLFRVSRELAVISTTIQALAEQHRESRAQLIDLLARHQSLSERLVALEARHSGNL